jgi:hypothetical protein
MDRSTRLQHRIFGILEEAGEDYLCTVVIAGLRPHGLPDDLEFAGATLISLLNDGYIELATAGRALPSEAALVTLRDLNQFFEWSSDGRMWQWRAGLPHVDVWLTDAGRVKAHEFLSAYGWPKGV